MSSWARQHATSALLKTVRNSNLFTSQGNTPPKITGIKTVRTKQGIALDLSLSVSADNDIILEAGNKHLFNTTVQLSDLKFEGIVRITFALLYGATCFYCFFIVFFSSWLTRFLRTPMVVLRPLNPDRAKHTHQHSLSRSHSPAKFMLTCAIMMTHNNEGLTRSSPGSKQSRLGWLRSR